MHHALTLVIANHSTILLRRPFFHLRFFLLDNSDSNSSGCSRNKYASNASAGNSNRNTPCGNSDSRTSTPSDRFTNNTNIENARLVRAAKKENTVSYNDDNADDEGDESFESLLNSEGKRLLPNESPIKRQRTKTGDTNDEFELHPANEYSKTCSNSSIFPNKHKTMQITSSAGE